MTNIVKIRLAARMPENKIRKILEGLIASRFVEEFEVVARQFQVYLYSRMQAITTLNRRSIRSPRSGTAATC